MILETSLLHDRGYVPIGRELVDATKDWIHKSRVYADMERSSKSQESWKVVNWRPVQRKRVTLTWIVVYVAMARVDEDRQKSTLRGTSPLF